MKTSDQQKPCPFCGAQDDLMCEQSRCQGCGAWAPDDPRFKTKLAAWNSRPIEEALEARLSELTALLWKDHEAEERDALDLLEKLASGEGGRRTGWLKQAGWLEWTVTPEGLEVVAERIARTAAALEEER